MNKKDVNTTTHRQCTICKKVLELNIDNFNRSKSRSLGWNYNCRLCERARSREKNKKRGIYILSDDQKTRLVYVSRMYHKTRNGKIASLLSSYRCQDKKNGLVCDLTKEFIINKIIDKKCSYCEHDGFGIGCDRIDNSLGHSMNNVIPCCSFCNIARGNNFTYDEMKIIGLAIKKVRENRITNPVFIKGKTLGGYPRKEIPNRLQAPIKSPHKPHFQITDGYTIQQLLDKHNKGEVDKDGYVKL